MRKFFFLLSSFFLVTIIVLEMFLSLSKISCDIPEFYRHDNDLVLYRPYSKGIYTQGAFAEIMANYSINNYGFNSSVDYNFENVENKVAIIGDSFIEGFHISNEQSIARQLASDFDSFEFYEFGFASWNIFDYQNVIKNYELQKFKAIFILIADNDLVENGASNEKLTTYKSPLKSLLEKFRTVNYLTRNLKITKKFTKKSADLSSENVVFKTSRALKILEELPSNCFLIFRTDIPSEITNSSLKQKIRISQIPISSQPDNWGFDGHWNMIGRKNFVSHVGKVIRSNPKLFKKIKE